jgi:hypothetical protein
MILAFFTQTGTPAGCVRYWMVAEYGHPVAI